ncbi:MAG: hypothetical protein QOH40_2923 [Arthrobacter pascens]|nr:hypothetical protein [Arthrobacter pascens]
MEEPFDLDRFVTAQNSRGTYEQALAELQAGSKRSHWMWFIFPQIAGLGQSATSRKYAIRSLEEAAAYVQHPVLGPRLIECADTVGALKDQTAEEVFGRIDARKLHSSATLFLRAAPGETAFKQVLSRFFDGEPDAATDELLREQRESD